jgi:hypothetical protein
MFGVSRQMETDICLETSECDLLQHFSMKIEP